jgi:large subunit ribosomal protein L10
MSKYLKDLVTKELGRRLEGVEDALLVNVVGLDANKTVRLRKQLRDKQMNLMVIKNNLARRACEGTPLAAAFEGAAGTLALLWGGEDVISLAKEVIEIQGGGQFDPFEPRGGVMDGEHLSAAMVKDVSKWPNREGQLSILLGQILSPGANLSSQLLAPGGALASQIEKKAEGAGDEEAEPVEPPADSPSAESVAPAEAAVEEQVQGPAET